VSHFPPPKVDLEELRRELAGQGLNLSANELLAAMRGETVTLHGYLKAFRVQAQYVSPVLRCSTCGVELGPFASGHVCPGGRAP
jgi:hypothetical protein